MALSQRVLRRRGSDGQVVPLFAAVVVVLALGALGLATAGRAAVDASRAQAAADAAALAAAPVEGEQAARRVAQHVAMRNGAVVTVVDRHHGDVIVQVRLGGVTASARARALPVFDSPVP